MTECLGCSAIEVAPVTLLTGETVCNACPAWQQECLERQKKAGELMAMSVERRNEAGKAYRKEKGDMAADRLWKVMQGMGK